MKNRLYTYRAFDFRVVDGDTVDCTVDLGFYMYRRIRLRLAGFDAPEIRGEERPLGLKAKDKLKKLLSESQVWIVKTYKHTGIYGRYTAEILSVDGKRNINEEMKLYSKQLLEEADSAQKG